MAQSKRESISCVWRSGWWFYCDFYGEESCRRCLCWHIWWPVGDGRRATASPCETQKPICGVLPDRPWLRSNLLALDRRRGDVELTSKGSVMPRNLGILFKLQVRYFYWKFFSLCDYKEKFLTGLYWEGVMWHRCGSWNFHIESIAQGFPNLQGCWFL